METSLQIVDRLAAELQTLLPIKPEFQQRLDKKIRLEFNYNSNHIEGNTLTYGETELLLIHGKTTGNHEIREYEEMRAHDLAYDMMKEWASDEIPITEMDIKNLHRILLVRPFWKEAWTEQGLQTQRLIEVGKYKEYPNSVRLQNGEMFHYASPMDTPIEMAQLVNWYRDAEEKGEMYAVVMAALLHYKFVRIHPFDDGNGRMARLLMNYVLLKNGLPPVIIKSADKKAYLFALNLADTGNIEAFIEFIAAQLVWTLELYIKAAKGLSIDEPGDLDKKLALLEQELEAVNKDDEIQTELTEEYFSDVFKTWVGDLLKKHIEQIQKFNKFFTGNQHVIQIAANADIHTFVRYFEEKPDDIVNELLEKLSIRSGQNKPDEIVITSQANFGAFRKAGPKPFGCNYQLVITFGKYTYEVNMQEFTLELPRTFRNMYEKLLHQPLLPGEIDIVISKFGEVIYEHIDYYTKDRGMRK